jgi:hypothetical protein
VLFNLFLIFNKLFFTDLEKFKIPNVLMQLLCINVSKSGSNAIPTWRKIGPTSDGKSEKPGLTGNRIETRAAWRNLSPDPGKYKSTFLINYWSGRVQDFPTFTDFGSGILSGIVRFVSGIVCFVPGIVCFDSRIVRFLSGIVITFWGQQFDVVLPQQQVDEAPNFSGNFREFEARGETDDANYFVHKRLLKRSEKQI